MAVDPQGPADAETWGVSAEQVTALALYVSLSDADNPDAQTSTWEDANGRRANREDVEGFIRDVSSRVNAVLVKAARLPKDSIFITSTMPASAADAVKNGAAAYLVGAASPESASGVSTSSYEAVLWQRHLHAVRHGELPDNVQRRRERELDILLRAGQELIGVLSAG